MRSHVPAAAALQGLAVEAEGMVVVVSVAVVLGGGGEGGSALFTVTVQASSDNVTQNVGTVQVTVP